MNPSHPSTPTSFSSSSSSSSSQEVTHSSLSTPSSHLKQEKNPRPRRESLGCLERFQGDDETEPLNSLTLELVPDIDPPSSLPFSTFNYPTSLTLPLSQTATSIPPSPLKLSKHLISPSAESSFLSSFNSPSKAQTTSSAFHASTTYSSPSKVHGKPSIHPSSSSSSSLSSLSSSKSVLLSNDASRSLKPRRQTKPSPFFYGSDSEDEDIMSVEPSLHEDVLLKTKDDVMYFSASSQTSTSSSSSSASLSLSQTPTLGPSSISTPSSSSKRMTLEEALDSENEHEDLPSQVKFEEDERIAFDPDQTIVPGDIRISILSPSTSLSKSMDVSSSSSDTATTTSTFPCSSSDVSSTFLPSSVLPTSSHSYHRIQALKHRFEQLKKAPLFADLPSTPLPPPIPSSSTSLNRPELHISPLTSSNLSSTFPSSTSTSTSFPLSSPTPSNLFSSSIRTSQPISSATTTTTTTTTNTSSSSTPSFIHASPHLSSMTPSTSTPESSVFSLQRATSALPSVLTSKQQQQQQQQQQHLPQPPLGPSMSTSISNLPSSSSYSAPTTTTSSSLFSTPPSISSSTMPSSKSLPKPSSHLFTSSSASLPSSLPRPTTFSGLKPPSLLPIPTPISSSFSSSSSSSSSSILPPPTSIPTSSSTTSTTPTLGTGLTKTGKSIPSNSLPKPKSFGFKTRPPSSSH